MKGQGTLNSLKPQPGQADYEKRSYHPLPGEWAQQQLSGQSYVSKSRTEGDHQTELQRVLASERKQHEYWEEWQGIRPGKPSYSDPRSFQNTLLPTARYGTDGR